VPSVVIIPVKSFHMGKRRLSDALDDQGRARLAQALAGHVAATVESAGLLPLIVTADAEVAEWATGAGFPSLPDPGEGLNEAARSGVEWAASSNSPWIVLHSDLPLLGADDVRSLDDVLDRQGTPIAPSSDGGTSAIGGFAALDFSFGVASFHRHLAATASPVVLFRTGLALDIDSANDLRAALEHPCGRWLEEVIG
jgi:2-phospho-L-lactate guanylyltransferase